MRKSVLIAALAAALGPVAAMAQTETLTLTPDLDVYSYWAVSDGGTRNVANAFAFQNGPPPGPQFLLDYRDGQMVLRFAATVPPSLSGGAYAVTSAVLTVYNQAGADWDPNAGELELWATGFDAVSESGWTGAYTGSTPFVSSKVLRDPYPREIGTDARAEDTPSALAWAVGVPPVGYTGSPAETNPIPIVFTLDVNDPLVVQEIREDLDSGFSTWTITSTFLAAQPPAPAIYPKLVTTEGAAATLAPAAPTLVITLEATASGVDGWALYE